MATEPAPSVEPEAQEPAAEAASTNPAEATADASGLFTVALRDFAFVIAALSLWAGADAWFQVTEAGFAAFLSSGAGLLAGAFMAAQLHEWGHFAGARISGGTAPIAPASGIVPLFNFDFGRSNDRHFRWMSVGGNLAHWFVVLALVVLIPGGSPGQLALQCGAFGFALFASSIEFPVIRHAFDGMPGTEALATITPAGLARSGWIGLAGALTAFVLF